LLCVKYLFAGRLLSLSRGLEIQQALLKVLDAIRPGIQSEQGVEALVVERLQLL
jgi:hypothetical protein